MAITPTRLTAERAAIEYTKRHARKYTIALLGDGAGNVDVTGRDNWVWVRLEADNTQLTQAKVKSPVDRVENLAVMVERVITNGATNYQVIGLAPVPDYPNSGYDGAVADHSENHEIRDFGAGGKDKLNVYTRAHVELRARAQTTPDMTVYVEHGKYAMNGVEVFWTGGDSPAFTAPSAGYKRFDLLYFDDAGALQIKQGTAVAASLFTTPSYPSAPTGAYFPLAYVLLTGGQTTITETSIADARIAWGALGDGAMVAHDIIGGYHTYTGGAALDVFGLSAANTLAKLTPSYDVSAGASAILRSNAGALTLKTLTIGDLTASTLIYSNASKAITSLANAAGYLYNDGAGSLSYVATPYTLPTPGTLTVSSTNSASGAHTHAIMSSSDVSAGTSALLASNAGALTIKNLTAKAATATSIPLTVWSSDSDAAQPALLVRNASSYTGYWRQDGSINVGNVLRVGDLLTPNTDHILAFEKTRTDTSIAATGINGVRAIITHSPASNTSGSLDIVAGRLQNTVSPGAGVTTGATYKAVYAYISGSAGAGAVISQPTRGVHSECFLSGSATYAAHYSGDYNVQVNTGTTLTLGVKMLLSRAFVGGTITTLYGLKIEDVDQGGTNYATHTGKGLNVLGDQLTINGSADRSQLIISGYTTQTNPIAQLFRNDGATATVGNVLQIGANSTGTPAAGFGAGQLWTLESSTTASQSALVQSAEWTDATHATRNVLTRNATYFAGNIVGYTGQWSRSGIDGTARTVIPNATGDVTKSITVLYQANAVTGTFVGGGVVTLTPNTSYAICSDGTSILTLTCASDGSVTIARSAGTDTFDATLWMVWR